MKKPNVYIVTFLLLYGFSFSAGVSVSLDNVEYLALEGATVSQMELERIKMNKIGWKEYFKILKPRLGFGYSRDYSIILHGKDSEGQTFSFSFEQPIYTGGNFVKEIEIKKLNHLIELYSKKLDYDKISLTAFKTFLSLLLLNEELKNADSLIEVSQQQESISNLSFQQGRIVVTDLYDVQIFLDEQRLNKLEQKKKYDTELANFKNLLNIDSENQVELVPIDFDNMANFVYNLSSLTEEKQLSNNVELNREKSSLKATQLEVENIYYKYFPAISLQSSYSLSNNDFKTFPKRQNWSLGLMFSFDLFGNNASSSVKYDDTDYSTSRRYSNSNNLSLFDNVDYVKNNKLKKVDYAIAREKYKSLYSKKKETYSELLRSVEINKEKIEILKRKVRIEKKRLEVFETRINLGLEKRLDYLKHYNEYNQSLNKFYQQVVEFITSVRTLEIEAQLPKETLLKLGSGNG